MGSELPTAQPAGPAAAPADGRWRHRRRKILIWGSASLAVLLVAVVGTGYTLLRHFNANIRQDDIRGLLGKQPVNLHPQAQNILVLGSDTRAGQGSGPAFPRGDVVPGDTANVLWTQPEDNQIFASFRDDVPASSSLFGSQQPSAPAGLTVGAHEKAGGTPSPAASRTPAASPSAAQSPVTLQARTANQNICAG
jgi:hypothetical protein